MSNRDAGAVYHKSSKNNFTLLMRGVKGIVCEPKWKKITDETKLTFVLLYSDVISSKKIICLEFKTPQKYSNRVEDELIRLLPYQKDTSEIYRKKNIQPDSTITTHYLMNFIRFFNEGFLENERIALIIDKGLIGSQIEDLSSKYTLNITGSEETVAFTLKDEFGTDTEIQEIQVGISLNGDKKISDLSINEIKAIIDKISDKEHNIIEKTNQKKQAKEEKINIAGTNFHYNNYGVYYNEKLLFKAETTKYIIFTLLAKNQKPIDATSILGELKLKTGYKKLGSIRSLISDMNRIIKEATSGMHRWFIKNKRNSRDGEPYGYYLDQQSQ